MLEYASREMAEIEKWQAWHDGRELGAGIVDVKSFHPESPDDVAERLRSGQSRDPLSETAPALGLTMVRVRLGRLHAQASPTDP